MLLNVVSSTFSGLNFHGEKKNITPLFSSSMSSPRLSFALPATKVSSTTLRAFHGEKKNITPLFSSKSSPLSFALPATKVSKTRLRVGFNWYEEIKKELDYAMYFQDIVPLSECKVENAPKEENDSQDNKEVDGEGEKKENGVGFNPTTTRVTSSTKINVGWNFHDEIRKDSDYYVIFHDLIPEFAAKENESQALTSLAKKENLVNLTGESKASKKKKKKEEVKESQSAASDESAETKESSSSIDVKERQS